MRDLYQRLALTPDANNQQIKSALARCPNSALRQDATSVLAVAPHRQGRRVEVEQQALRRTQQREARAQGEGEEGAAAPPRRPA